MFALDTVQSIVIDSLTYPGASGFAIIAMMGGLAALAELDRIAMPTIFLCWSFTPILWGGYLFTSTGSLPFAAVGTVAFWALPGLGFVLIGLVLAILLFGIYHQLSARA